MRIDKSFIAFLFLITILLASYGSFLKAGDVTFAGGGNGSVTFSQGTPIAHYNDVVFYDNMDSTATGRAPIKGSGTFNTTSNFFLGSPLSSSSTASNYCNTEGGYLVTKIAQSGNLDYSAGRIGFYFSWDAATFGDVAIGWYNSPDSGSKFRISKNSTSAVWDFKYSDVVISTGPLASGTTNYVEFAWDINSTNGYCAEVRINGGAYVTDNSCSAGVPSGASIGFLGDANGNANTSVKGRIDEVIISSNSQRDLYAIRNLGLYPD